MFGGMTGGAVGEGGLIDSGALAGTRVLELDVLTTHNALKRDRTLHGDSRLQRLYWRSTQSRGQGKALQMFTGYAAWSILIDFDMSFDALKST